MARNEVVNEESTPPTRIKSEHSVPAAHYGRNNDDSHNLEASKENHSLHSQRGTVVGDVSPKRPSRKRSVEDVPEDVKNLFKRIPTPEDEESLGQSLALQDPETSSPGGSLGDSLPTLPSRFVSESSLDDVLVSSEAARHAEPSAPSPVPEESELSPEISLGQPLALQEQVTSSPGGSLGDSMPSLPCRFLSDSSLDDVLVSSEAVRHAEPSAPSPVPEESELSPEISLGQPLALQEQVTSSPGGSLGDSMPSLPCRFLSDSSLDDVLVSSEAVRHAEPSAPSLVPEESELSPEISLGQPLALQEPVTSSPGGSLGDSIPSLPCRFLSDSSLDDEHIFPARVVVSSTKEKHEVPGHTSCSKGEILSEPLKIVDEEPTESSHTPTTVEPEVDIRALVVSRIPKHIMEQLSLQEWYRILEPTVPKGTKPVVYDDVYGEDEEVGMTHQIDDDPREESKTQEHIAGMDMIEYQNKLRWSASMGDAASIAELSEKSAKEHSDETSEKGGNVTSRNSWMERHIAAYDDMYYEEIKEQDYEDGVLKRKTIISFGTAYVRRHERVLEVHPSTSSGPSVGIGWNYTESEEPIVFCRKGRRNKCHLLSREDREKIVHDLGYSKRDIAKAVRKVLKIKARRRRTANNLQRKVVDVQKMEYMAEKCNRKIKKCNHKIKKLHTKLRKKNSL